MAATVRSHASSLIRAMVQVVAPTIGESISSVSAMPRLAVHASEAVKLRLPSCTGLPAPLQAASNSTAASVQRARRTARAAWEWSIAMMA